MFSAEIKTGKSSKFIFDMKDNKITKNDKFKLNELVSKFQYNILILNALHIEDVHHYRVIDYLPVSEEIELNIESKEDYLLYSGHYHFDLLYDVNIIIPTTEMEIRLIFELCSKKKFTFKTLSSLSFNETDSFEDFILKLYRHNLINWSSIGNISFASNSKI